MLLNFAHQTAAGCREEAESEYLRGAGFAGIFRGTISNLRGGRSTPATSGERGGERRPPNEKRSSAEDREHSLQRETLSLQGREGKLGKRMMPAAPEDYYAALGLDRRCTAEQIRDAYRLLAKRYHPDRNGNSAKANECSRALNAAYEVLSDPQRRRAYDRELDRASQAAAPGGRAKIERNIRQELHLSIENFLQGTTLEVQVKDPANLGGAESYRVEIPAMTAPGTRLRLPRSAPFADGHLELRLKVRPGFRFKARGADLRTDLRISAERAEKGGTESIARPTGGYLRVVIPRHVKRGELLRVPGEGMPKARGGRGDLLVRVTYRPQVRVSRIR